MGQKKNCIAAFRGITAAQLHGNLGEKELKELRSKLQIPHSVSNQGMREQRFPVKGICEARGVQLETEKNGHPQGVWIAAWKLHPITASASA